MDQIMGKVGGYWFNQKANKELDDMNVKKSSTSSVFIDSVAHHPFLSFFLTAAYTTCMTMTFNSIDVLLLLHGF
jgi:hypothetical protein